MLPSPALAWSVLSEALRRCQRRSVSHGEDTYCTQAVCVSLHCASTQTAAALHISKKALQCWQLRSCRARLCHLETRLVWQKAQPLAGGEGLLLWSAEIGLSKLSSALQAHTTTLLWLSLPHVHLQHVTRKRTSGGSEKLPLGGSEHVGGNCNLHISIMTYQGREMLGFHQQWHCRAPVVESR